MALLLETLRSAALTSIYGRRLGIDSGDYLVGTKALRLQVEDITSTVPTTLSAYGLTRILTSGSSQGPVQHLLPVPVPGVQKKVVMNTTSTASYQFLSTANGASILAASDGTTKSQINIIGAGGSFTLEAVTSAIWAVTAQTGSTGTPNITYTTST